MGSRLSQSSIGSIQTQRQNVGHKIHVSEDQFRESDFNWTEYTNNPNIEEAKDLDNDGALRDPQALGVTFQQLKEYDKLVIQLIKDQINQENR